MHMYPQSKGFEIVFISTNTIVDVKSNTKQLLIDWAKLFNNPFMKTDLKKSLPLGNKDIFISAWHGTYSNYINYACQIEGYSRPDLVVSFHPSFTTSPQKLINEWTDDLKIILTNEFSCLFTFYDKDEGQKAFNILNAFQAKFICVQTNQFSSLTLKQTPNRPNHIHASNSVMILIKGFDTNENEAKHTNNTQH